MSTKKRAVYLCDSIHFPIVYRERTLELIASRFEVSGKIISSEKFDENAAELLSAEFIFSTWGMPSLTVEQIKKYLPNVKAVFYGAGSVRGFAHNFMKCGVKIISGWGANAIPVAEYTLAQILLANKGTQQAMYKMRKETYESTYSYAKTHPGNYDVKVGIVGAGMIGQHVMRLLQPFSVDILVYDPYVSEELLNSFGATRVEIDELFSLCQVISNHTPNIPATVGMMKYEHFSKMKKNATFINTGRGPQIVEADLIRALIEEPDRTAVLDVTNPEPPVEGSPLYTLPNVYLTPHTAGSMENERARMGLFMQEEAFRFIDGENLLYEVTEKMMATMA